MVPVGGQRVHGFRGGRDLKEGQGPGAWGRSEVTREVISALDTLSVCPGSPWD